MSTSIFKQRLMTLVLPACLLAGAGSVAAQGTQSTFVPDANIEAAAQHYAADAVRYALIQYSVTLDGSEKSIAGVETVLGKLHDAYVSQDPKPTDTKVLQYAQVFGSYIGEVYRRNHGGQWGLVTLGDQRFPGMQSEGGTRFSPWAKTYNRITQGSEDNIVSYYDVLLTMPGNK